MTVAVATSACDSSGSGAATDGTPDAADVDGSSTPDVLGPEVDVFALANGCYLVEADGQWLGESGSGYAFTMNQADAASFFLKASDLGTYLLYDEGAGYLVSDDGPLLRRTELESDFTRLDDTFISGAEWEIEPSPGDPSRVRLRNRKTRRLLGAGGLVTDESDALRVSFVEASGCTPHPELTLDATGDVQKTTFDDGDLYGIVDTHSHILSNFGFGGGGIFHGGAFHRLGVEHALGSCEANHGVMGKKDFFGFAFDTSGPNATDLSGLIGDLLMGELSVDNHVTDGYPEFTEWPDARRRSTHQQQYYRWLERAHLAGLRLVVQHATTNSAICTFTAGTGIQSVRYACDDMVGVDRIIDETYNMERYIDAQAGGPGEGFFRVVQSPAEAREVIGGGKMAVILGIETSDLFDCRLSPNATGPVCDADYVRSQLDAYFARGVRAIFPVHKYDNAFSAGDGDRAFIELGNFVNSGYWGNFTLDCPVGVPSVFDKGDVFFGGLNQPRDEFMMSSPPNDFSNIFMDPLGTMVPFLAEISAPPLVGDYCQKTGLTPIGETLIAEMMQRGMIIEVDHLPKRAYERAFELLEASNYPAAGTHGQHWDGRLYALGGVSKTGLGRCRNPAQPGEMFARIRERVAAIEAEGGYPAEGFGFDLNGFAGAPGPRLAAGACSDPQDDPITYPFRSIAGDVEFTQPRVGNREIDFNQEGFVHIGMLPELLQDARGDATSDADYDPLFRSAEGYIRMWERAEERAAAIRAGQ